MDDPLRQAVAAASLRPDAREAVLRIYVQVQAEIDRRRPRCEMSGRCCRFEEFGHRLYVTTLELAAFVHDLPRPEQMVPPLGQSIAAWDGTGCAYQIGRLCGIHGIRPFGCRMFFCDASATEWQQSLYERFHGTLKRLHEELDVPYFYVEWRRAVRMLTGQSWARSGPQWRD
jgi:Fe-S-cluster containining protein